MRQPEGKKPRSTGCLLVASLAGFLAIVNFYDACPPALRTILQVAYAPVEWLLDTFFRSFIEGMMR